MDWRRLFAHHSSVVKPFLACVQAEPNAQVSSSLRRHSKLYIIDQEVENLRQFVIIHVLSGENTVLLLNLFLFPEFQQTEDLEGLGKQNQDRHQSCLD